MTCEYSPQLTLNVNSSVFTYFMAPDLLTRYFTQKTGMLLKYEYPIT